MFSKRRMCRICRARGLRRSAELAVVTRADVRPPPPPEPGDDADAGDGTILCGTVGGAFNAEEGAHGADTAVHAADDDGDDDAWHRVVVGAGVAGVCCAEELARQRPHDRVTLVSSDDAIKAVTNVRRVTRVLETFDVTNKPHGALRYPNLTVVQGIVEAFDGDESTLVVRRLDIGGDTKGPSYGNSTSTHTNASGTNSEIKLKFDQLCVCVGAEPRRALDPNPTTDPHDVYDSIAVTVRDTESVEDLRQRLGAVNSVVVAGNGGIAMELVQALCWDPGGAEGGAEDTAVHDDDDDDVPTLVWLCKHPSIGDAFFDRDASDFLLNELQRRTSSSTTSTDEKKHSDDENIDLRDDGGRHKRRRTGMQSGPRGGAAGPDWTARLTSKNTKSKGSVLRGGRFRLRVVTDAHLARLERDGGIGGETFAVLGDGTRLRTDLLVSAAGVDPAPRLQWLPIEKFPRGVDGGLAVDGSQRTLGPHASSVFAAGDCASMEHRELSMHSGDGTVNQWFQMRLWSQARQSGTFAARVRVFFWLFLVIFCLFFFGFLVIWFSPHTVCSHINFVFFRSCAASATNPRGVSTTSSSRTRLRSSV